MTRIYTDNHGFFNKWFGTVIFLFICSAGYPQREFNNWYFGDSAGMSFNSGPPVTFLYSAMDALCNGESNISDSLGNILFYTNGWEVWNRNNQIMPNGWVNGGTSTMEYDKTNIAFQQLADPTKYYLFVCNGAGYPVSWLRCSVIDMNLDFGLGDIVPSQNGIHVPGTKKAYDCVTAARTRNNRDVWVVVRLADQDSNYFASYLVNAAGLNLPPVFSNSRVPFVSGPGHVIYNIKISRDGTKMAAVYADSIMEFGHFNTATGQFTSLFLVTLPKYNGIPVGLNSAEFSRDSKFLYVAGGAGKTTNSRHFIYQFDATLTDSVQFRSSGIVITNENRRHALQLAPDGKIYCSSIYWIINLPYFVDSLNVINNPSLPGLACNYQKNAVGLQGRASRYSLPDYVERYYALIHDTGQCVGNTVHFSSAIWPPPDSIHWDFGDMASGAGNYSTLPNPTHTYPPVSASYTVELYVRHNDNRTDTTRKVINVLIKPNLGADQIVCDENWATFDAGPCPDGTYLWKNLGTGLPVSTSQVFQTNLPGTYAVYVTNPDNCTSSDTVTLSTTPVPTVTNSPLSKTICSGQSTNISLTSNVSGTNFYWTAFLFSGGINGFSTDSGTLINQVLINSGVTPGIVHYFITPKKGSCAGSTVTFSVTVDPSASVNVTIAAGANNICAGTSVTFTATPVNGGTTPAFQWNVNGVGVGSNNLAYTYAPANGDLIKCILTSSLTGCIMNNPDTSNVISMVVNPILAVSVSISASANPFCQGSTISFTATPNNGGSTPVFHWKVNGFNVGTNNPVYSYVPANGDIVSCVLNSNYPCPTGSPATSNTITMTENTNVTVTLSISPSLNPVCSGTLVNFTATPGNQGSAPVYQWKVNGVISGTNSTLFSYVPLNGDLVTCKLTSNAICASGNPATSNTVTMIVNPNQPVSISITSTGSKVCSGSTVTFNAFPINQGTIPLYQWKVNGINAGINSTTYSYVPLNGDQVLCTLNSNATCATGNPATSNVITMTVNPNLSVSINITASANPVCSGIAVTYTATPTNGGSSPVYQWKVNGGNTGSNSPVYSYNPVAGDQIYCILNSSIACPIGNPATSNTITMSVGAVPVVTFTRCFDSITTTNAKPIKLKGGIPLGGVYSGPGVNSTTGTLNPAIAGAGIKTITYTYTNSVFCSSSEICSLIIVNNSPFICGSTLTDNRDNKIYPTVQIGSQCWMAANLDFGLQISDLTHQRDNCIPEKYLQPPPGLPQQGEGGAYQWGEIMRYDDTPGLQGLCPPGWHVPTEAEWNTLFAVYTNNGFAGSPLKYSGYSGFNALLSGVNHFNRQWDFQNFATFFWSSTPYGPYKAWSHGMNDYDPSVSVYPSSRQNAFSVRCILD